VSTRSDIRPKASGPHCGAMSDRQLARKRRLTGPNSRLVFIARNDPHPIGGSTMSVGNGKHKVPQRWDAECPSRSADRHLNPGLINQGSSPPHVPKDHVKGDIHRRAPMKTKHNPERRAWKGKSYKKGGKRVLDLRLKAKKKAVSEES